MFIIIFIILFIIFSFIKRAWVVMKLPRMIIYNLNGLNEIQLLLNFPYLNFPVPLC